MSLFGGGHKSAATTQPRAMGIDLQGAQYGAPIPVVFGRNRLPGNVIDYMDFKAIAHTQKQQGGKGGGGGQSSTSYTYSCSYLLGLCEGVGNVVSVYDGSSVTTLSKVGGLAFSGAIGQAPWAHLSGDHALGYSGTVLVAFQNKDLGSSASLPNYNFEIDGRNQFSASIKDANPADIVTAICTDTQIGVNFTALGDLTAFKNYCTAAGLFFSPVYATQNPAQQTIDDLIKYANCAAFFSEGQLKVVPYGDATITGNGVTYTPNLTAVADLTRDDFITNGPGDPVTIKRIAPADAMNIQRVEFKDRANTYHTGTVVASIDQDVVSTGARADHSDSVDMITDAGVARLVAQNLLQRTYYIRNTYEFQLSWRYCYLEPMDIVTLTDANTGLYQTSVRITEVSEDEHGLLSIVAEEFPEGVSHASTYATQPNAGTTVDPNADPGPVDGPYLFRGPGFLVSNAQPEIWCALSGNDPLWAGCDVYLSHDGTSYTYLATHSRRAAYGVLSNTLPSVADPDTTSAPNVLLNGPVQLLGGTQADADQFITLAMVDNEIIAYQTATLASGPSYTLGYLRRGGYGSAIAAHAANAPFVRLDENILRIPVDPSQIGQTVYLKFVSFNVFGKGGRTLADETAYTYVVGTNIELPDVPVTPASVTVTGVADGNSITWSNPNPAAVGCTSIEYATASGGPWTVLAQVGPTTTAYAHHFTNGATYYYRLRSRGAVVSAGWSAYTAVISGTGTNVGAISTTANQANANTPAVINPQFQNGTSGWTFSASPGAVASGEFYEEAGANSPYVPIATYLVHHGQAGQTSAIAHNTGVLTVTPGQIVAASCAVHAPTASANDGAYARAMIEWLDSSGNAVGTPVYGTPTAGNPGSGTYMTCNSRAAGPAPTGAAGARLGIQFVGHTSGYLTATGAGLVVQPSSLGEVPDGGGRFGVHQVDGNGLAIVDFSQSGHVNKNLDNIGDGPTYGRALGSRLTGGKPWIDFSETIHVNKNLDYIANTGSYTKTPVMGGSAIVVPNANFLAPIDANANVPGWVSANAGVLSYFAGTLPFGSAQCLHVTFTGSSPGGFGAQAVPNFKVDAGDTLFVKGWAYADTGGAAEIIVYFFNSSGTYLGQITAATAGYGSWQQISASGVAPSGTSQAFIRVFNPSTGGGSSYFYGIHVTRAANLDSEAVDGSVHGRIAMADVYQTGGANRVGLRVPGSGHILGNQLNAPNSLTLNYGAARTATALSATSAGVVNVNAFGVNMGGTTVNYNAVSNAVTGLTVGATYQIYCRDPGGTGGTKTWYAVAGNQNAVLALGYDDAVLGGQVTIPSSGSSGGGGTGCPQVDEPVIRRASDGSGEVIRAGDVRAGDHIWLTRGRWGLVSYSESKLQPGVRVVGRDGSTITCSASAPLETADGPCVPADEVQGLVLWHRREGVMRVHEVIDLGDIWVQHITCEDDCFLVGDYSHHNMKP